MVAAQPQRTTVEREREGEKARKQERETARVNQCIG